MIEPVNETPRLSHSIQVTRELRRLIRARLACLPLILRISLVADKGGVSCPSYSLPGFEKRSTYPRPFLGFSRPTERLGPSSSVSIGS